MSTISFRNTYARLPERFFSKVHPFKFPSPHLIRLNSPLAERLGIDPTWLQSPEGISILSGNKIPDGAEPLAQVYAGHQFAGWAPQLGDGRAILMGEVTDLDGIQRDLQWKGSGQTPYSRRGDGKSALGPVLREYLVSEAMTALGVPSTRSLAALATGELVQRETRLPGGILLRVAASHIRVGTFQYFYAREDREALQKLADYTLQRHYPKSLAEQNPYLALLENVLRAQASLVAQWMRFGFIHGVMNTDNVALSGETLDYGPCAFMDTFHPRCVFSYIDQQARYAWGNQPAICHWNLTRLAESLLPLLDPDKAKAISLAEQALDQFPTHFEAQYKQGFCRKLGVSESSIENGENNFIQQTLHLLAEHQIDYTLFFRRLTNHAHESAAETLLALFDNPAPIDRWLKQWQALPFTSDTRAKMKTANPIRIPRNHQVEKVIQSAYQGDFQPFHRLHAALEKPYEERMEFQDFEAAPLPHEIVAHTFCGT